jgi:hypothetical protein
MHGPLNVSLLPQHTADGGGDDDNTYSAFYWKARYSQPVKQQSVVTHTIRRNEIPASPRSSVTNAPSVKMWRAQKISVQTC